MRWVSNDELGVLNDESPYVSVDEQSDVIDG